VVPAGPTFEQKMAWILRLEDRRLLREPAPEVAPPSPVRGKGKAPIVAPPPAPPDLIRLLADGEARVRRRAALAVGRVGLRDGTEPLVALLRDADPEVRQMAAFALGLLGDVRARDPLVGLLADSSPLVQGSAAEALGLLGDSAAAEPIGLMVSQVVQSGALAQVPTDDREVPRDSPVGAFRLGVYALARLKAFDPLASAVLDSAGQPRVWWWPVAFAIQQLQDKRALSALLALAKDEHPYTRMFAIKGLGALKDRSTTAVLLPLLADGDRNVVIETIRALARIGDEMAAAPIVRILQAARTDVHVRIEALSALGAIRGTGAADATLDWLADPDPGVRAAALRAAALQDPDGFVTVLSGLDPDPDWQVRATLASLLATLTPEVALPRLTSMLADTDQRVVAPALSSLVKLRAPGVSGMAFDRLTADDAVVRATAARGIGELKPENGIAALVSAYQFGQRDATYVARAAALEGLAKYGAAAATPLLETALTDKDWAVRVRAATLLSQLTSSADVATRVRPAPTPSGPDIYQLPRIINPSVSTQVYFDTDRGTIQVELAVLDAPITVENFVSLARKGFFTGLMIHRVVPNFVVQTGDPRGDSEGGPGYTIRDELNQRPYLRGTVGMALDWPDTGGSQFFIVHSPQPQLDARYTVFGQVVGGMEVIDQLRQGDVIRRVRVWDGQQLTEGR
jgi:cyclophilin family peptidyl-prolyl cis-trans isomerase/HEAT repeat protein